MNPTKINLKIRDANNDIYTETFEILEGYDRDIYIICPWCSEPMDTTCENEHIAYTIIEEDLSEKVFAAYTDLNPYRAIYSNDAVRCEKCMIEIWEGTECACGIVGADHQGLAEAYQKKAEADNKTAKKP